VDDLKRMGRDLERTVLARAVRMHVHDRILVSQNKTVVFD
jgi:formyltetrahydrofolate deformylase